ncbi:interleukin-17 receptor B isoform X1 [Arapaima gigas]
MCGHSDQTLQTHVDLNVTCVKTHGIPPGWMHDPAASPSVLKDLKVSVAENGDGLRLNISWAINIDKSTEYLTATWIDISQTTFKCLYDPPLWNVTFSGQEEVWFHFTDFPAEPEEIYFITGFNIPVSMAGGDSYSKVLMFEMTDCSTGPLKYHDSCVQKGSLWEPNVTAVFLNDRVEVNFTASEYSEKYAVELWEHQGNQLLATELCHPKGESKCSKVLSAAVPCEHLKIWIQPYFPKCAPICEAEVAGVVCRRTEDLPEKTDHHMLLWIVLCCILTAATLALISVFAWRNAKGACLQFKVMEGVAPVSVLLVYPAVSSTFQRAVVTLAEFLKSHGNCTVTIDMWQRGQVAEMGLVHWLTAQMEAAEKVIFVTASNGSANGSRPVLGPTDYKVPASVEDMFSLALNVLASGARDPTVLRKYVAVHLGHNATHRRLPAALTLCKSFCLMRDLGRLCSHLHENRPSRNFLDFILLRSVFPPQDDRATVKLRNAVQELQMWEEDQTED